MKHTWSAKQKDFLREHYPLHNQRDLLQLFNEFFGTNVQLNQLKACLKNHNITSGRTGHFNKGHVPFNKGLKGVTLGGVETQFKKGQRPLNYKPVGYERVDRDGYILVKVSDTGAWQERWRHKHKVIWEAANGSIPKGHVLIFLDRDKLNVSLDNLQLITNSQLARMNQNKLFSPDPELTKTGAIIADVYCKIGERIRGAKSE